MKTSKPQADGFKGTRLVKAPEPGAVRFVMKFEGAAPEECRECHVTHWRTLVAFEALIVGFKWEQVDSGTHEIDLPGYTITIKPKRG